MMATLKPESKIEAIAACMAGFPEEWVTLDQLHEMISKIGFAETSVDGTRNAIASEFKKRGWSKAKHNGDVLTWGLRAKFFEQNVENVPRFIELTPDAETTIRDNFADYLQANLLKEDEKDMETATATNNEPEFVEPEEIQGEVAAEPEKEETQDTPTAAKKRIIVRDVQQPETITRGKKNFGGAQPPGLVINGVKCSYSTLIRAIVCAQNEPFTKAEITKYANAVVDGLNIHSIGNGWYLTRKYDLIKEVKGKYHVYEYTNELFTTNRNMIHTYCKILPGHALIIKGNYKKAERGLFRSQIDKPEKPEQPQETEQAASPPDTQQPETPIAPEKPASGDLSIDDIQEVRQLAVALGIIDDKPAFDPKIFIGECVVSYLQSTSGSQGFTAIPKINPEIKSPIPEKPLSKDEFILQLKEVHGKLKTMQTAKEKAERLAREFQSANFELKQQKAQIENELNRLKFQGDHSTKPGEAAKTQKLADVVRIKH